MISQSAGIVTRRAHEIALLFMVAASAAIWSSLYVLRYNLFQLSSDTGAYEQIIWNTVNGRILVGSVGPSLFAFYDAMVLPVSEFYDVYPIFLSTLHTNFIAVAFSPVYLALPYTETLLITSMTLLSIGAIPLYLVCRDRTGSKNVSLAVVFSYLLSPGLHAASIVDFNYFVFAVPAILFAFYFMLRRRWVPFWASVAVLLSVREEMCAVVVMLGLYMLFFQKIRREGLAAVMLGVAAFAFIFLVVFGVVSSPLLGSLMIPLDPGEWTGRTGEAVADHLWRSDPHVYLASVFAHTGFLSFLSPAVLLVSLSEITKNLLAVSDSPRLWWNHYQLAVVPGVYLSAVFGIGRVLDWAKRRRRVAAACVIAALVSCALLSNSLVSLAPIKQMSVSFTERGIEVGDRFVWWEFANPACCFDYQKRELDGLAQVQTAREALSLIPPGASVSTEDPFIAHLSQREHLYYFPTMYDKADYVFAVYEAGPWFGIPHFSPDKQEEVVQLLRQSDGHEVLLDKDGLVLFRAVQWGQGR